MKKKSNQLTLIKINQTLSPFDFSSKAREIGFDAVEYVSSLYWNELETKPIKKGKKRGE